MSNSPGPLRQAIPSTLRPVAAASLSFAILVAFVVVSDDESSTGTGQALRLSTEPSPWNALTCNPPFAETPIFHGSRFAFVTPVAPPASSRQPLPTQQQLKADWTWPAQALNISRFVNWGAPRMLPAPRWSSLQSDVDSGHVESLQPSSYSAVATALKQLHRAPRVSILHSAVHFAVHSAAEAGGGLALTSHDLAAARRMLNRQCEHLRTPKLLQLSPLEISSAAALHGDAPVPLMCTRERAAAAAHISEKWGAERLPADWLAQLVEAVGGVTLPEGHVPHCIPSVLLRMASVDVPVLSSAVAAPSAGPSVLQALLGDNQYRPHALLRRMVQQHGSLGAAAAPMRTVQASLWKHPVTGLRTLVPQAGMQEHHSLAIAPPSDNSSALLQHSAWRAQLEAWRQLLRGERPAPAAAPGDADSAAGTGVGRFACGSSGQANMSALHPQCAADAVASLVRLRLQLRLSAPISLATQSVWGIPRGMASLAQLFRGADGTMWAHQVSLHDAPRVPWRGMHTDTARHFQSQRSIKAVLASMAAAKLNVLHWHITDAQSFPLALQFVDARGAGLHGVALAQALVAANGTSDAVQARMLSQAELDTQQGVFVAPFSPSAVYTQSHVADIVWEAALLGVRVLPEVDSPAHAASWAWALQSALGGESSSTAWAGSLGKGSTGPDARGGAGAATVAPPPWEVTPGLAPPDSADAWNRSLLVGSIVAACHAQAGPSAAMPPNDPSINIVNRYALDPSNPAAYAVLAAVLQGTAAAFPDAYFHWGGDEVYGECWGRQQHIVRWAEAHRSELGLAPGEAGGSQGRLVQALVARHAWFVTRLLLRAGRLPVVWQGSFDMLPPLESSLGAAAATGPPLSAVQTRGDSGGAGAVSIHSVLPSVGTASSPLAAGMPPFNLVQPWKCWGGEDKRSMLRAARDESTGGSTRNSCWYLDWPSTWPDVASHKLWSGFQGGLGGVAAAKAASDVKQPRVRVAGAAASTWEDSAARSGVWGGEVSLWSEGVVSSNQLCRVWPRAASVAQRLWTWAAYSSGSGSGAAQAADALSVDFAQMLHFNHFLQHSMKIPSADFTSSSVAKDGSAHDGSGQCATVHRFSQPEDEYLDNFERRPGTAVDPHKVFMKSIVWNAANGGEGDWPPPDTGKQQDASGLLGRKTQLGGRSGAILDAIRSMDVDVAGVVEANGWSSPLQRDGARALAPSSERHHSYQRYLTEQRSQSPSSFPTHIHRRQLGVSSSDGLRGRAARAGLAHSVMLNTPSGYDLAFMAKWPIAVLYTNVDDFERGVLVVAVRGHAFVLVHLHAHDSSLRTAEAVRINALVQELTQSGWPVAIMGDFNTLSPIDAALHQQHRLLEWLLQPRVPQRVKRKHLTTAEAAISWSKDYAKRMAQYKGVVITHVCLQVYASTVPSQNPVLDYRPMCELLAAGTMHDDCPASADCSSTEPTAYSLVEGFSAAEMPPFRLDYVLVNPVLVDTSGEHSCQVLKTAATEWLSDHFPVVCSL